MTVRGADRLEQTRDYETLIEYARQDGLSQWWREFIANFEAAPEEILRGVIFAWQMWEDCPDRVADDHDDWCRTCRAFLWLRKLVAA